MGAAIRKKDFQNPENIELQFDFPNRIQCPMCAKKNVVRRKKIANNLYHCKDCNRDFYLAL